MAERIEAGQSRQYFTKRAGEGDGRDRSIAFHNPKSHRALEFDFHLIYDHT